MKKLNSQIPLYHQLKDILTKNDKIIIYNALSGSVIRYGIELYAKNEDKWTRQLQKNQNRLIKILFKMDKLTGTNKLHKNYNILKISDNAKLRTLLISHKFIHNKSETNNSTKEMKLANTTRKLRSILNFEVSAEYFNKFNKVIEKSATCWNDLNNETKLIKNRNNFKHAIAQNMINAYV